jgi:nitrite reductase/ring-hydroxylating ferredoxin subunit
MTKIDMQTIGPVTDFTEEGIYPLQLDGLDLLLIHNGGTYYLIENKCGHFGIPLADGAVKGQEIICKGHGISFDMCSGQVINRPYENCEPIKTLEVAVVDGVLCFREYLGSEGSLG